MFGGLYNYKGEKVEINVSNQSDVTTEIGTITNIVIGQGENAIFVELDKKMIINVRYIIKIKVID